MTRQINLFDPELLAKRGKPFSAAFMLRALLVAAVAGAVLYGSLRVEAEKLAQLAAQTEGRLAAERSRLQALSEQRAQRANSTLLTDELKAVEARLRQSRAVAEALEGRQLGNTKGYSEYMRAFARQAVDGLWLTGFEISEAGTAMTLRGRVLQPQLVPLYLERLKGEPAIKGRSFEALQIQVPKQAPGKAAAAGFLEFELRSTGDGKEER